MAIDVSACEAEVLAEVPELAQQEAARVAATDPTGGVPANDAAAPADAPGPLEVLTLEQLAVRLQMNPKSLREIVARGGIPGCRKVGADARGRGGAWRAHWPTVVGYLAGQDSAPPKKAGRR